MREKKWKKEREKLLFFFFSSTVSQTLQANGEGIIQLGQLKNVEYITVSNKNWSIGETGSYSYPRTIHADAGTPLKIPYMDK